jgi:hypothetical protein
MKVLLCTNEGVNGVGERLERLIARIVPGGDLKVCRGLRDFSRTLHSRLWEGCGIAVILATNQQELEEFVFLHELLDGLPIILVLPDRGRDTITKGHALYPRFLSYADAGFEDVAAVLKKMLELADFEKHGKRRFYEKNETER